MIEELSALARARAAYSPRFPSILGEPLPSIAVEEGPPTTAVADAGAIRERFPVTYGRPLVDLVPGGGPGAPRRLAAGVVLSGGQAPGGHNVIAGLLDGLRAIHPDSELYGFLGGPKGIFTARYERLTPERLPDYRNTGGFDLLGSGRDKIETPEQFASCREVCDKLGLDGLVVVGGDDSNTNAALLAEYFSKEGCATAVLGVPKTIDGDLKGEHVEVSFGFDTATKVYSELIGNICRDARSAGKYWHFIRLMGRSASHVTLECALQTHVNVALIGEEVRKRQLTLRQIGEYVASVVRRRAQEGRPYGVLLVPEGLIEFVPEMRALIDELNGLLHDRQKEFEALGSPGERTGFVESRLEAGALETFRSLPERIREQLVLDRDAHGNVKVSQIDTERLLVELVASRVSAWREQGSFRGEFQVQGHFFGYEGRCAQPTNFDADYTYSLGRLAAVLAALGRTGYLCSIRGLAGPTEDWRPTGVPLTSMMQIETRKGKQAPVIAKALVRLEDEPFRVFASTRERWEIEDDYVYPGAIQYFGPTEVTDRPPVSLTLEQASR